MDCVSSYYYYVLRENSYVQGAWCTVCRKYPGVFSNWQLSLKSEHKDKIIVLTTVGAQCCDVCTTVHLSTTSAGYNLDGNRVDRGNLLLSTMIICHHSVKKKERDAMEKKSILFMQQGIFF